MKTPSKLKTGIYRKCLTCTIQFYVAKYRLATAYYCSRKCKYIGTTTRITKTCEKCSKAFEVISTRAEKAKFCSFKCRGQIHYNTPKPCKYCQKIFKPNSTSSMFCSLHCSLYSKIDKTPIYGKPDCWLWTGYKDKDGYGKIKSERATRVMYEYHYSIKIPEGLLVCHECDTPSCINPEHLFLGTYLDNNRDKIAKGRENYHFKPGHPQYYFGKAKIKDQ